MLRELLTAVFDEPIEFIKDFIACICVFGLTAILLVAAAVLI